MIMIIMFIKKPCCIFSGRRALEMTWTAGGERIRERGCENENLEKNI